MSLTPFSVRVRDRALAATLIAFLRNHTDQANDRQTPADVLNNQDLIDKFKEYIIERLDVVDHREKDRTLKEIDKIIRKWKLDDPDIFGGFKIDRTAAAPLMVTLGTDRPRNWNAEPFQVPTSMRNVDKETRLVLYNE